MKIFSCSVAISGMAVLSVVMLGMPGYDTNFHMNIALQVKTEEWYRQTL